MEFGFDQALPTRPSVAYDICKNDVPDIELPVYRERRTR